MRLCLVISSLHAGGAERVLTQLANAWSQRETEITILTFAPISDDFFQLHPNIQRISLNAYAATRTRSPIQSLSKNLHRLWQLRRAIQSTRPNAVISFMDKTNILTLIATRGLSIPVLIAERTVPDLHPMGRATQWLRKHTYPWANAVIHQTQTGEAQLNRLVQTQRSFVVPNPICRGPEPQTTPSTETSIFSMGRFTKEKGTDLLIAAFSKVAPEFPDWKLKIAGAGPEQPALEQLVHANALQSQITFLGQLKDPWNTGTNSAFFVLPSRYEGFPNVLLEAMSHGMPVLSFDCPNGPRHIIRDKIDGLLVEPDNVEALAEGMRKLITDANERHRLAKRAQDVRSRFSLDKILGQWDRAIEQVSPA